MILSKCKELVPVWASVRRRLLIAIGLTASISIACGEESEPLPSCARPGGELQRASWAGDVPEVDRLLSAGEEVNGKDDRHLTALHWAAIAGHAEVARALLRQGADPNAPDRYMMTPLHWAAFKGRVEMVRLLLRRGARVDARNLFGMTPLCESSIPEVAAVLLDAGADLTSRDDRQMTPLHHARNGSVAKLMLERGADIRARAADGRTAVEMWVHDTFADRGIMVYAWRPAIRLRGDRAHAQIVFRNISECRISDFTIVVDSPAATVKVTPAKIARFEPAQIAYLRMDLSRRPNVVEGEYPVVVTIVAGGAQLGAVELRVDNSASETPEDRGMIRLGRGSLRPAPRGHQYLIFLLGPLAVVAIWLIRRWRKSASG